MKKLCAIVTAVSLLTPWAASAQLTPPSTQACTDVLRNDLTQVHDTYRSYLFGSREVPGGKFEVLTGGYTDAARTGIFETKRRLTSELVAPLIEAYRVYRCRSLDVCAVVSQSFTQKGGDVDIHLLGCAPVTVPRYLQCYISSDGDSPGIQSALTEVVRECQTSMEQTLNAEESVLKLAVAYDAGYRSLLQMAGMMDWMLEGFPTAALKAVSEMVNMLGKLHQIPCFIGQCDNPRSDYLKP